MAIELSNVTFTEQDDVVPESGMERIFNIGITNTLGDNDIITGYSGNISNSEDMRVSGISNTGILITGSGNDTLMGIINDPNRPFNFILTSGIVNRVGTIDTGEGDDLISGINNQSSNGEGVSIQDGIINTSDGNDTITGFSSGYGITMVESIIDTGKGNDIISGTGHFIGFTNTGTITTGEGNDIITGINISYGISNAGTIDTGNGQDSIFSRETFRNKGGVFLGDGNDSIIANIDSNIGSNPYAIMNYNTIETGDGEDIITNSGGIYNEGVINTGNGNDSIISNTGFESGLNSSGAWFLGEGDDYIKGFGSGDFYGGNGKDTLELIPGTYTVGIWGEGGESPIFTKGNQLMITSEFEKLKAASTIYDFTSLTAGQIIVVA
jgi:hypothetical protein